MNEITLSDNAPNYWYYDRENDHRFNTVDVDASGITAIRNVDYLRYVKTDNPIHISEVEKPLYLVFISLKRNENSEPTEIHRQSIKIKWKRTRN